MTPRGQLDIAAGFASARGRRADNQDYGAVYLGTPTERARHGITAIVADGVGGAKGGRVAAELAVRAFIDGYYASAETLGVATAGSRTMQGFNRWLHAQGRDDERMEGAATTFTGLILRGRRAHVLHVGDSRAWHARDGVLTRLTEDHTLSQPDLRHVLYRAVGIEPVLRLDRAEHDIAPHDRLLIASDGVHGVLDDRALMKLLARRQSAEADAQAIVDAALAAGSTDNATAIVLDIVDVPPVGHDAIAATADTLDIPAPPNEGDSVDGFRLDRLISDGRYTRLFRANDPALGAIVLKFPKPALLSEHGARLAFLREALIGERVTSPYVGSVVALPPGRQSRLYVVQPFYEGETLEARLTRRPLSIDTGVVLAARLARGVAALHRLGIVHRDIKPDNVLLTGDDGVKLIDLGVARLPRVEEFDSRETPGTPSYMAPEMFDGEAGSEASDQYALGVTLYRAFTGRYPYGEVEPFTRPRFDKPTPPARHRPDMPAWLEAALLRAVAIRPADRFGDVQELVDVLEGSAARAIRPLDKGSFYDRNPLLFWKLIALTLTVALLLALALR